MAGAVRLGKGVGVPGFTPRPAGREARVVLVEGHDDSRETWAMALSLAGFAVRSFDWPPDALAAIWRAPPEVVVTSIALAGLRGDELARALRAASLTSRLVIVAAANSPDDVYATEAGLFDRVLVKPVDVDHLVAELWSLVGRLAPA
jgi:DNA-binding response OmpR family regulator